jgi:hypothetical protein
MDRMDVTINLNLTLVEVRQLLGFPDNRRLHDAALDRILALTETFSADGPLNTWFGGSANSAMESFREVIGGALTKGLSVRMAITKGEGIRPRVDECSYPPVRATDGHCDGNS